MLTRFFRGGQRDGQRLTLEAIDMADQSNIRSARVEVPSNTPGSKIESLRLSIVRDMLKSRSLTDKVETTQRAEHQNAALVESKPQDELQSLVASQILLANSSSCGCFRRADVPAPIKVT